VRFLPSLCAAGVAIALWLASGPRPGGVVGRLGFAAWTAFALACGLAATAAVVALLPAARRRGAGLRAATVWIGVLTGLAAVELACWLWPAPGLVDNPFYLATGAGVDPGRELPFERPAHLRWTGRSRGDLAIANGDDDPHARLVRFDTDHEGFRNPDDRDRADVLFLGDSHTEAGNVPLEETFPARVGARLGVRVHNLGRAGTSPSYQLVVLRRNGLPKRPQRLVWQLTETNDLGEEVRFRRWLEAGRPETTHSMRAGEARRNRVRVWQDRSPSHRLFRRLRRPPPWPMEARFPTTTGEAVAVRFLRTNARELRPPGHPGWPLLGAALEQGRAVAADAGIEMLVLLIPAKLRALAPALEEGDWVRGRPEGPGPEGRDSFAGRVGLLCERLGVPFLDATPLLREASRRGELVYQPLDTHLSARGHELVADRIVAVLTGG
jgi:hypothetical protein